MHEVEDSRLLILFYYIFLQFSQILFFNSLKYSFSTLSNTLFQLSQILFFNSLKYSLQLSQILFATLSNTLLKIEIKLKFFEKF